MVSICPRCLSTSITTTDRAALAAYRELYYRCRDCSLEAKLFPEVAVKDLPKLKAERIEKKELAKKNPNQNPQNQKKFKEKIKAQNQKRKIKNPKN